MPLSLQTDLRQCVNADSRHCYSCWFFMAQPHSEPPFPTCGFHPLMMKDALHRPISA